MTGRQRRSAYASRWSCAARPGGIDDRWRLGSPAVVAVTIQQRRGKPVRDFRRKSETFTSAQASCPGRGARTVKSTLLPWVSARAGCPRLPAMTLRLSDVTALLDGWYDPAWAEDWDAVGLVCGDPDQPVLGCCSPSTRRPRSSPRRSSGAPTCSCATTRCCSPPSTGCAATTPKGRVVHDLVRGRLRAAHRAHQRRRPGRRGQRGAGPRRRHRRPRGGASTRPTRVGAAAGSTGGTGAIGRLTAPTTLREFADRVSAALPATAHGVRVAGDPDRRVRDRRGRQRRPATSCWTRCSAPTPTST